MDFNKNENSLKIFYKLIEKADIILDSQKESFLEKLKIDKNELLKKFPKLILINLTGYGITENNHKAAVEPTAEINRVSSINSIKKILEFFKNKENTNNKFINPLIILGDLFGGCIMPLYDLSIALMNRKKTNKGAFLESVVTANLFSLSVISDKLCDSNKFHFSCHSKNIDYVLFSIDIRFNRISINNNSANLKNIILTDKANEKNLNTENNSNTNNNPSAKNESVNLNLQTNSENNNNKDNIKNNDKTNSNNNVNANNANNNFNEGNKINLITNSSTNDKSNEKYNFIIANNQASENLNFYLKKICERLLIEVLNLEDLPEGLRLNLTRDYIDYFQLITKSFNDSVKYIKDLCKLLEKDEILKQLKKFEFLEIYPVIQFNELMQYFKYSNILKGDYIIKSFTDDDAATAKKNQDNKPNNGNNNFNVDNEHNNGKNYFEDKVLNMNNNNLRIFGINEKDLLENNLLENKNKKEFKPKL